MHLATACGTATGASLGTAAQLRAVSKCEGHAPLTGTTYIAADGANPGGPADFGAALPLPLLDLFSKLKGISKPSMAPAVPLLAEVLLMAPPSTFTTGGPLPDIANTAALRLETATDTSTTVTAAFRSRNYIMLRGRLPSSFSSCKHFIQAALGHRLQMLAIGLAAFTSRKVTHRVHPMVWSAR